MAITVAVVNNYDAIVQGVSRMFSCYSDRIQVVELDADSAVAKHVDIVVFDTFAAAQGNSDDAVGVVRGANVGTLVAYSWNTDQRLVDATAANGVGGYLSKNLPASTMVDALEDIHHGRQRTHIGAHSGRPIGGDWPGREEGLTQREAEVLALITQGLDNASIADRAYLSINSVKTLIRSCYRRIGTATRTQAVLWGADHGFRPDAPHRHP